MELFSYIQNGKICVLIDVKLYLMINFVARVNILEQKYINELFNIVIYS